MPANKDTFTEAIAILNTHNYILELHTQNFKEFISVTTNYEKIFTRLFDRIEALEETVREMDLLPIKPDGTS